ncbi:BrnT family toxin [Nitratireductor soli]|uniref:BrnT family toxin n=1 Tax=Nitratireductor soli TaxID=1670619 RepID=UPI00065E0D54|nr:BrnT family toxin [Nitratireductor soli]
MNIAGVEWDTGNRPKCAKHGVSKAEIEFLLRHGSRFAPDPKHSHNEDCFIAVGRNEDGRPMFVGVTFRNVGGRIVVCPITARYMHAKEAQRYEAQGS